MKTITAFLGSPRRKENTGLIVDMLTEGIRSAGMATEVIHLSQYKISGCKGCLSCSKTGKCVIDDDMSILYPKVEQSDGYIFASPTFNYNITSEMKAFIDRLFCYYRFSNSTWASRLGNSKKAYVVGVCAGEVKESKQLGLDYMGFTILAMVRPLEDLGVQIVKEVRYYNTKKNPVKSNINFHNEVFEMGIDFAKIVKDEYNLLLK